MNRTNFKRKIAVVLIWMLAVGCIGLSGMFQAGTAAAQSVGVTLAPPVACEEPAVQQTVYVSVYNKSSGQTLCYQSSLFQLTGSIGDQMEVTVHMPEFGQNAVIEYQYYYEPYASYEYMQSLSHKLSGSFVISQGANTLQIGVRTSGSYGPAVYAKPSGTLAYSRHTDSNGVLKLNPDGQSSQSGSYDLFIDYFGYAEWGVQLVDSSGQPLSGAPAVSLNNDGRHSFLQVPVPADGQIYAVYTPPGGQGSGRVESVLIGHLPDSGQVVKVVLDPEGQADVTLDQVVRTDATLNLLARFGNLLYLLDHEPAPPWVHKEIVLEATRNSPNNPTSGGVKHLLTVIYTAPVEQSPYENSHYIPIYTDYWRTVTLVHANPAMPGGALSNVRVYLNLDDYPSFNPMYTYTDSQGKATFYDFDSYSVELPYTYNLASEDGGNGHKPALIQVGPDFWNNDTGETQLKVTALKRPGSDDPNSEFQLKDLVWFAQNFQSPEYLYDLNQDGDVTKEDLNILLRILAPTLLID